MIWRLAMVALILQASVLQSASAYTLGTDRYDRQIQSASERFLPGWDWRWYRAQLYQESRLDPSAVSSAGAAGIAQFMPGTWRDIAPKVGAGSLSPHVADSAILAGAYYMSKLRRAWKSERPESDRRRLAQASYNAGTGNILAAQHACNDARHWPDIAPCLHAITGTHADETLTYVERIERWFLLMGGRA